MTAQPRGATHNFIMLVGLVALNLTACQKADAVSSPENRLGSTSLCADSYLLALAPNRIGALSWQAGSALSTAEPSMESLPRLWASREVLAGTTLPLVTGPGDPDFGRANTAALTWGDNFDTAFQADIASLSTLDTPSMPPRVLYLSRSGGSAGPGTFIDAVITAAGGVNANETPGWHTPAVERTLQFNPDLIVTSFFGSNYAGVSDRAVRHSALRRYLAERPRVDIPGKLWLCAGPGLIEATRQLNAAILAL
jgi:iron complex transport system substrate-binding protein